VAFAGGRLAVTALVTLLLSLGALTSPTLLQFFSPAEIVLAWLGYLGELAVIAAVLLVAFAALDGMLPRRMPLRLPVIAAMLLALSALLAVLLHAYFAGGFGHLPPPLRMLADSLRWDSPQRSCADRRRAPAGAAGRLGSARGRDRARAASAGGKRAAARPAAGADRAAFPLHMLGNVRRLYRTDPRSGAEAIDSLMHYLRGALPQLRSRRASFGEEISLVRAYLDLFKLRMGAQLVFLH